MDSEKEEFADYLAEKLAERHKACHLSDEERDAVKNLIQTKKSAVKAFVWICGALVIWIIKDIYIYIVDHLSFK